MKNLRLGSLCLGFILMTGCAQIRPTPDRQSDSNSDIPAPKSLTEVLTQDIDRPNGSEGPSHSVVAENGDIVVQGIKLKNTKFDIPITVNSRVEFWIDYFCGRGRGYFQKYLERSEYFIPYIAPLLKQNGLPEDLVYLAMIESGFNNLARSRAKAVGPWQFISATGRRYGLAVNWWADERRDIRKSTLAAAGYLKDLYVMFQSWELAAAAYNAGESKIARGVRRLGSKDFWVISRHQFLRPETRDYVPKIIAAAIISKNRTQFGFPEQPVKASEGEALAGDGELVKLVKTDKPIDDKEYRKQKEADIPDNDDEESDEISSEAQPIAAGLTPISLTVPVTAENSTQPVPLAKPVPTPHLSKNGKVGGEELMDFDVQSPADLLKIARAAGLSYTTVKSLNPEVLRWCTPPTQASYRIKLPAFTKDRFLQTYNHGAFPRKVQFMTYKVHRGETLTRIARHFGIKVDPMSDLNGLSPLAPLRSGAQVLLPLPNDRSRTFASLEVRDPPERRGRRHHRRHQRYFKSNRHRESASVRTKTRNS